METEESLRSGVNHENGVGRILTFLCEPWTRRRKNPYVLVWSMKTETEESLRSSVNHEKWRRKNPYVLVWTMNTETEESLPSGVNRENGDGRILTF